MAESPFPALSKEKEEKADQGVPLQITWLDSHGNQANSSWMTQSEWVWEESEELEQWGRVRVPILRTRIAVPRQYEVKTLDAEPSSSLRILEVSDDFRKHKSYPAQIYALDLTNYAKSAQARFYLQEKVSGKVYRAIAKLELKKKEPILLVDPVCEFLQLDMKKKQGSAEFFFLALTCEDRYDKIDAYLISSYDGVWRAEHSATKWKKLESYLWKAELAKPIHSLKDPFYMGEFDFSDQGLSSESVFLSYFKENSGNRRFVWNAGVAGTFLSYSELVGNSVSTLEQVGVTGKAGMSFMVFPRWLTFDASAYGTLLPISVKTQPTGNPGAVFYGLNARLGYDLPVNFGSTRWMFLAGWYQWGMLVANNQYGLSSAQGPQVFVSVRTKKAGYRAWSAYVKYASVGTNVFNLNNREIAFGGAYQLSSPFLPYEILLTGDISNLSLSGGSATAALATYSLGFQLGF